MDPSAPPTERAPRDLRFAVIGAGMAGILSAIKLREAGFDDFTVYEKADRARRHLAREHLSRPRVRRAVAPLPLLVRAEPGLEPPVLAGPRDPARTSSGSPTTTTCASVDPLRRRGQRPATFADGRWHLETAAGHQRRGRRRDRRHRRAPPPEVPRHRRARRLRRVGASTAPAGTTTSTDRRRPRRHHRRRARPRCRSSRAHRRPRRAPHACSSARRSGCCRRRTPPTPTTRRPTSAPSPRRWPSCSADLVASVRASSPTRSSTPTRPQMQMHRGACAATNLEPSVHDPGPARAAAPDYRAACKRLIVVARLLRRDPATRTPSS